MALTTLSTLFGVGFFSCITMKEGGNQHMIKKAGKSVNIGDTIRFSRADTEIDGEVRVVRENSVIVNMPRN
ncbi:hypothetical protein CVD19_03245 [Bacillus sp. T33-2]|nr:hypothetical protein CVD19_03245 [Bacillus sp. T33-2]